MVDLLIVDIVIYTYIDIAWIKKGKDWIKCDDDVMSLCEEGDIEKLYGSADWHTGYILLYKARISK